jgi:adenine-specific DNA glycosylase
MCPVIDLCATRGELRGSGRTSAQKKREIHYALYRRDGSVLMVQRPRDTALMAGMWELPEISSNNPDDEAVRTKPRGKSCARETRLQTDASRRLLFSVKHSITVTDFQVRVWQAEDQAAILGSWISRNRLERIPLTGLARKILRKAAMM